MSEISEQTIRAHVSRARQSGWWRLMLAVEREAGLPQYLLAAIASRETSMRNVVGDGGHGRGLFQIDDRAHGRWLASVGAAAPGAVPGVKAAAEYAAAILRDNLAFAARHGIPETHRLRFAVAAYNAGPAGALRGWRESRDPDARTTGRDYSRDVLARRQMIATLRRSEIAAPPSRDVKEAQLPLVLVSPPERGAVVVRAQRRLARNRWGDFEPGPIDGVYGRMTAEATRRAKWALGFPAPDQVYGLEIDKYLSGARPLPADHQALRRRRLAKLTPEILGARAWALAEGEVGTVEHGNNRQKYGEWYGWNGVPWCAQFVTWVYVHSCGRAVADTFDPKAGRYAFCPYIAAHARSCDHGLYETTRPYRGALVLFDWDDDRDADHVGLFGEWVVAGRTFVTIEGNTSDVSRSNGGMVMRRVRSISDVDVFVGVRAST